MDKRLIEATIKIGDEIFHLKREVVPEKVAVPAQISNFEKAEKAIRALIEKYKGYAPAIKCNDAIRAYGITDGHWLRERLRIKSRWDKTEKQYFWSYNNR